MTMSFTSVSAQSSATIPAPPEDAPRAPRNIVLLSDGTGNSSKALFKTNVWRLYQALDLSDPSKQVAYYDDGVGTSSFRPLALLGGAFGWGLKRNIHQLYAFLCLHYRPGDRIYAFGFSRGAFTVRILCSLILRVGIVKHEQSGSGESRLRLAVADTYRAYRKRFVEQVPRFVRPARAMRDAAVVLKRRCFKQPVSSEIQYYDKTAEETAPHIEFIGVWDTVAAYGMPLEEMAVAVDKWVWPMSMPQRFAHPKVRRACHALAIDDERESFQPLLWNEENHKYDGEDINDDTSASLNIDCERISQVWFAGMHSDIGGGYPDDSLAHVPLNWMIERLAAWGRKQNAGLLFDPAIVAGYKAQESAVGPMHDSRAGLCGSYRYLPRSIERLCHRAPAVGLRRNLRQQARQRLAWMRKADPNSNTGEQMDVVRIRRPKIHHSVFDRIAASAQGYAPFMLPPFYALVSATGAITECAPERAQGASARYAYQTKVAVTVWKRRVVYFLSVIPAVGLAIFPAFVAFQPPDVCEGFFCGIAPAFEAAKGLFPGYAAPWIDAFAARPDLFLAMLLALSLLLALGGGLKRAIGDQMRHGFKPVAPAYADAAEFKPSALDKRIGRLIAQPWYKTFHQWVKLHFFPALFGLLFLAAPLYLVALMSLAVFERITYALDLKYRPFIHGSATPEFKTCDPFFYTGQKVEKGGVYRVTLQVTEQWFDASIPTDPRGISEPHLLQRLASPLLRASGERYFKPIAHVVGASESAGMALNFLPASDQAAANVFFADFTSPETGDLYLFVNDALSSPAIDFLSRAGACRDVPEALCRLDCLPKQGKSHWSHYANNRGAATVQIQPLFPPPPKRTGS